MSMKYDLNRNLTMKERVRRVPCDLFNEIRQNDFKFDHFDWFFTLFYDSRSLFFFSLTLSTYRIKYHQLKNKDKTLNKTYDQQNGEIRWIIQCAYMVIALTEEYTNNKSKKYWEDQLAWNCLVFICVAWRFTFFLFWFCANSLEI